MDDLDKWVKIILFIVAGVLVWATIMLTVCTFYGLEGMKWMT